MNEHKKDEQTATENRKMAGSGVSAHNGLLGRWLPHALQVTGPQYLLYYLVQRADITKQSCGTIAANMAAINGQ